MKVCQIRHAYGERLNEFYENSLLEKADEFVSEERAGQIVAACTHSEEESCALLPYIRWPTAKILRVEDVNVKLAPLHIEDAPDYKPTNAFEGAAIRTVAYPQAPTQGYPRTKVTILLNGESRNVTFKIVAAEDVYDWPCWALV